MQFEQSVELYQKFISIISNNSKDISENITELNKESKIPFHRVISNNGLISGFFGEKDENNLNVQNKIELLKSEGILFNGIKYRPKKNGYLKTITSVLELN